MSYNTVADIRENAALARRITVCVSKEVPGEDPQSWVMSRQWVLANQPGWEQAWLSAVANGVIDPGKREDTITDEMILSAVQAILAAEVVPAPSPDPEENSV